MKLGRIKFNVKDYRTRFTGLSSTKKDAVDADVDQIVSGDNENDCNGLAEHRCTNHTP